VTAVCSAANAGLVTELGADDAIDYTATACGDVQQRYDFIFDAVGKSKTSRFKREYSRLLAPGGRALSVDDGNPKLTVERLARVLRLAEHGVLRPVVDRTYPLEQIALAHRYVEAGHKRGNVMINIAPPSP
jgi:alcohol dehydrogenase